MNIVYDYLQAKQTVVTLMKVKGDPILSGKIYKMKELTEKEEYTGESIQSGNLRINTIMTYGKSIINFRMRSNHMTGLFMYAFVKTINRTTVNMSSGQ